MQIVQRSVLLVFFFLRTLLRVWATSEFIRDRVSPMILEGLLRSFALGGIDFWSENQATLKVDIVFRFRTLLSGVSGPVFLPDVIRAEFSSFFMRLLEL